MEEELLKYLVDLLTDYLEELKDCENEFECGEKTAFVEVLEVIQLYWPKARFTDLNYDIEKRFPL